MGPSSRRTVAARAALFPRVAGGKQEGRENVEHPRNENDSSVIAALT